MPIRHAAVVDLLLDARVNNFLEEKKGIAPSKLGKGG